jgi:hypothetical protein
MAFRERVIGLSAQELDKLKQSKYYKEFLTLVKDEWDNLRPADHKTIKQDDKVKIIAIEGTAYTHFSDIYTPLELKRDGREVQKIKNSPTFKERDPITVVGEYIIMEGIWHLQWISEDVEILPTHEFDDIKRGTDFVLRFEDEKETNFYLGVDVTTSSDNTVIKDKRGKILEFLAKGDLEHLQYFEDPDLKIEGKVKGKKGQFELPKIVIVLNPKDAEEMLYILLKIKARQKLPLKYRQNIIPEEAGEIKKQQEEMEFVRSRVEEEFISQLKQNMEAAKYHLDEQRERDKYVGETGLVKKFEKAYQSYKKLYERIKKEA